MGADNNSEKSGIIVIMDILGTQRAGESDWKKYINAWETFIFDYDILTTFSDVDLFMFSDTVIIAMPTDNVTESFSKLGKILLQIFLSGIKWGLFFRGAISFGRFFMIKRKQAMIPYGNYDITWTPNKHTLLIGPAVNEANSCYNKSKWIGISTTSSATDELERMDDNESAKEYFIKCDIKKYGVCQDGWAFAWPRFDGPENLENPNKEYHITYLENQFNHFLNTDEKIAKKYENTINFYKDIRTRG